MFSKDLAVAVRSILTNIENRQSQLEALITEVLERLGQNRTLKEWYSTTELADAMGKSRYTVQERWCNEGRIECEKDPETGKWRIPGAEYWRLTGGGSLRPKQR